MPWERVVDYRTNSKWYLVSLTTPDEKDVQAVAPPFNCSLHDTTLNYSKTCHGR